MQHTEDLHQQYFGATAEEQYHVAMRHEQQWYEEQNQATAQDWAESALEAIFTSLFGVSSVTGLVNDGYNNYTGIAGDGRVYTMKYVDGGFIKGE